MAYLGNPAYTMAVLEKHGFHFQKKYGQNFLIDKNILEKIVDAAQIGADDVVLEIGPGIGTMTQYLCERAREVIAVEIDDKLIPVLGGHPVGIRQCDGHPSGHPQGGYPALAEEKNGGRPIKVVANLPYYITTPIIMELFESRVPLESVTVMVQKEVAERMKEGPGSKHYGALSLAVAYYAVAETVAEVPPACFVPRPKVSSMVIRLTCHREPPVAVADERFLFSVIRASFQQRRKTLVNGINNAPWIPVDREEITRCVERPGYGPSVPGREADAGGICPPCQSALGKKKGMKGSHRA